MSRWSLVAMVTLIAVLAGSYIVFSRPGVLGDDGEASRAETEIGVEEFETDEAGEDPTGAVYELEGDEPVRVPPRAQKGVGAGAIETIEDEESLGTIETIEEEAEGDEESGLGGDDGAP